MRVNGIAKKVTVKYTSKPLSGWGGVLGLVELMDRLGVREVLRKALPDERTSPNQVDVVDAVVGFWLTATTGGKRFAHVERLRGDEALRTIAGVRRFPSDSMLTRYFRSFTPSQNETLQTEMRRLFHHRWRGEDILDLDSTTLTRYGSQEGSTKGYHPTRPGQRSHQPLLAMLANAKMLAHAWLRTGNASTLKGAAEFIRETVAGLPPDLKISCVRADSGFASDAIFKTLEELKLDFVIATKMTQHLRRFCSTLQGWTPINADTEISSGFFQPFKWNHGRRVVVLRRQIGEPAPLLGITAYDYDAMFTSLTSDPAEVFNIYRGRGDCENRIKELKQDFGITGFCIRSFIGTEVAFRLLCTLYNVVAEFKRVALQNTSVTLGTIRHRVFVMGASVGSTARTTVIRLGLATPWCRVFDQLRQRIAAFDPTAPHLSQATEPSAQSLRWQLRPTPLPSPAN